MIEGKEYIVHVFLSGDHMLMYKIAGCDPPSYTRPEHRPCPYCDANLDDVASFEIPCPAMSSSVSSMFPGIPIKQFAIDCSDRIVKVLFTVRLPLVHDILENAGLSKSAVNDFMGGLDVDVVTLTSEDGSIDGSAL